MVCNIWNISGRSYVIFKHLKHTHTATASSSGRSCQSPHACAVSMGGARPRMLMCSEQPSPRPGVNSNRMSFNSFFKFLWDRESERDKRRRLGHLSICPRDSQKREQSGKENSVHETIHEEASNYMIIGYFYQTTNITNNNCQFIFCTGTFSKMYIYLCTWGSIYLNMYTIS